MLSCEEWKNRLCQHIHRNISKRISNILYRQPVLFFSGVIRFESMNVIDEAIMLEMLMVYRQNEAHVPILELYVEFE
ncbi:hypothetical protein AHAS_Ahas01G0099900 [Arachis hypogaea]